MRNFKEYSDMEVSILVEEMQAGKVDYSLDDLKDCQAEVVNRRLNTRYAGIVSDLMKDRLINKVESDVTEETPAFTPPTPEPTKEGLISNFDDVLSPYNNSPVVEETPSDKSPLISPSINNSSVDSSPTNNSPEDNAPLISSPINNSFADISDEELYIPEPALRVPSTPPVVPAIASSRKEENNDLYNKMQDLYYTPTPKKEHHVTEETDYPVFKFISGLLSALPWISMICIYSLFGYNALHGMLKGNLNFLIYGGIASVLLSFTILLTCLGAKENLIWKMKVAKKLDNK